MANYICIDCDWLNGLAKTNPDLANKVVEAYNLSLGAAATVNHATAPVPKAEHAVANAAPVAQHVFRSLEEMRAVVMDARKRLGCTEGKSYDDFSAMLRKACAELGADNPGTVEPARRELLIDALINLKSYEDGKFL